MSKDAGPKVWAQQIRGPFLILSIVLVLVGVAAAGRAGHQHWVHAVMLMIGVLSAHVSVNLFNELSDYRTGIDSHTVRTPFSGGSGMLQAGKTSPQAVSTAAYGTMIASAVIGLYFCLISGWFLLLFIISGAIAIRFYTSCLAKWLVGEVISGLTLGTFVVLGSYYALAGHLTAGIVLISIPPGILTSLLLFLNEFPDAEADMKGGRHHLVIHYGKEKSAWIYAACLAAVYLFILVSTLAADIPITVLIALFTLPLAFKAAKITLTYFNDTPKMVPALGMNVGVVLLTDLLLAIGLFI